MTRRKQSTEPSIFRFMCIKTDNKNYHVDFPTREEALKYVDELNDAKIEWYGVYELDPRNPHLVHVASKRLIPHNDYIPTDKEESSKCSRPLRLLKPRKNQIVNRIF